MANLFKHVIKISGILLSVFLFFYLLYPYSPGSIEKFSPLPDSLKSTEPGDTVQVKNVSAFFSNHYRDEVIPFYMQEYQKLENLPFPPLRLNYPPEFAYIAIKDQTQSTYLEELVYPLRGSVFINGFEPFYEDGTPKFVGATDLVVDEVFYDTKTTIRYYPSSILSRFLVWVGITTTLVLLWKMGRSVL